MNEKELRELAVLFAQQGLTTMKDISDSDYLIEATPKQKKECLSYVKEMMKTGIENFKTEPDVIIKKGKVVKGEVVVLDFNVDQYGLQENKAKELTLLYEPMLKDLQGIEDVYNDIVARKITPKLVKEASTLRKQIVKIRTRADKARIAAKAEYLRANKAIQGLYNTFEYGTKSKEDVLFKIENDAKIKEELRIKNLQDERVESLQEFKDSFDILPSNLGEMTEEVWNAFYIGIKTSNELKIQAEKQAAEELIEKERKAELYKSRKELLIPYWNFLKGDQVSTDFGDIPQTSFNTIFNACKVAKLDYDKEQLKIQGDNLRLKKAAKIKEKRNTELRPYIVFIRDYEKMISLPEEDYKKELKDVKIGAELQWEDDRKEQIKKSKENENLRKSAEEAKKALKEVESKIGLSPAKSWNDVKENSSDEEKFEHLIADLTELKEKYTFKSKRSKYLMTKLSGLLDRVIAYIVKCNK